jgi:3-deoxy-D-manno-octulosonic-acid transferase
VHGASVGEGVAANAIIREIEAQHPNRVVLRTAMTNTGLKAAKQGSNSHYEVCALPFDAWITVGRWLDRVRPQMIVLVEAELWPELLLSSKARGIPVAVVGARFAKGGRNFERLAPRLFARTTACISHWLIQAPIPNTGWMRGVVESIGDPKLDIEKVSSPLKFAGTLVVAGSTRSEEEPYLIEALNYLNSDVQVLIAPRHLSRLTVIEKLLNESGYKWAKRSELTGLVSLEVRVILLDTMGELASFYSEASAAFVGGTLSPKVGGHSPAEAAAHGVPLVAGPHTWSNTAAWRGLSAVTIVRPEELCRAFHEAILQGVRGAIGREGGSPSRRAVSILSPLMAPMIRVERPHRPLLMPFAWIFLGLGAAARGIGATFGRKRVGVPVISIGAIAAGGSGKTPAVQWVVDYLSSGGKRSAVISRGYRRSAKGGRVRSADVDSSAQYLGDELSMLHKKGIGVYSSPNRREGAEVAVARGAETLVLDDGFQQRSLHSDLDIVVVDANHITAGGVIPVGEGREGLTSIGRAHVVWINRGSAPSALMKFVSSGSVVVEAESRISQLRNLRVSKGEKSESTSLAYELAGRRVWAFCGIAHPGRFLEQLLSLGVRIRGWKVWRDHHQYTASELDELHRWSRGGMLVTTEKDAARIEGLVNIDGELNLSVAVMTTSLIKGEEDLKELIDGLSEAVE